MNRADYLARQRELERTTDRLHKHEAEELLQILASHFGIPTPNLSWTFRSKRGWANYRKWNISSGPLAWRGTTNSLLHEFAHLLNHKRNPAEADRRPHGKAFIATLYEVIEAWHGNASQYSWGTEYVTVRAAGPRQEQ